MLLQQKRQQQACCLLFRFGVSLRKSKRRNRSKCGVFSASDAFCAGVVPSAINPHSDLLLDPSSSSDNISMAALLLCLLATSFMNRLKVTQF